MVLLHKYTTVAYPIQDGPALQTHLETLEVVDSTDGLVGQLVVVKYDGKSYPSKVLDLEEDDIQVTCMAKIGISTFFWPAIEDACMYQPQYIIRTIPEQPFPY